MIVRLTRRQHGRLLELVDDQMSQRWRDGVLEWATRDVVDASSHRVDVAMPAIAWKRVWGVLFDHCFDHRGMRSKGVRVTDHNAMKAVRRSLNVRESHPALSGVAAIGVISELIPAWRLEPPQGGYRYSPYPVAGQPFVVLAPTARQIRRQRVTQWVEAPRMPERPILDDREHWRFA
jgi:hypothetical protein